MKKTGSKKSRDIVPLIGDVLTNRGSDANFATIFACVVDTGGEFATGVNDTGGKFAAGVVDTGGK